MRRIIILILLLSLIFIVPCYAAMKLYISDDCGNCDLVMEVGKRAIQQLKDKDELEVIDISNIKTDLPGLPALVDGEKVIIGTGILEYLADKTELELASDACQIVDGCLECSK